MRRGSAGPLAVALACSLTIAGCGGCEESQLDPDAAVTIDGRVLDASRLPVTSLRVGLTKRPDAGEVLGGLGVAVATAGLACVTDDAPSFCADAREVSTDDDGRFSYDLTGKDTQGSVGNADDLDVVAGPAEPDGPSTQATFRAQQPLIRLPTLRLWPASPQVADDGGSVLTSWQPLPRGFVPAGSGRRSSLSFDAGGGRVIWTVDHARSPVRVDSRVLEDVGRGVSVLAATRATGGGTPVDLAYDGGRRPLTVDPTAVPLSRGAPCRRVGRRGVSRRVLPDCTLTDGVLDGAGGALPAEVAVDLGRARPVDLVVLHGCGDGCVVRTSTDGRRFRRLGRTPGGDRTVAGRGRRARWVAVTSSAAALDAIRELSVWVPGENGTPGAGGSSTGGSSDDGPGGGSSVNAPSGFRTSSDDDGSGTSVDASFGGFLVLVVALAIVAAGAAAVRRSDASRGWRSAAAVVSFVIGLLMVASGVLAIAGAFVVLFVVSLFSSDSPGSVVALLVAGIVSVVLGSLSLATARGERRRDDVRPGDSGDGWDGGDRDGRQR